MPPMQAFLIDAMALLIPILGVMIPLVVVTGRFVVQPMVQALSRLAESSRAADVPERDARMARIEQQVEEMAGLLRRVAEEQEFRRALESPAPAPAEHAAGGGHAVPETARR
jgi:hypothetical protein